MAFFKKITSETKESTRKNAVLMGRKTWDSIPAKFRPLANRINIIISSTLEWTGEEDDVYVVRSFEAAVRLLSSAHLTAQLERIFVIGGESIYKAALESSLCDRIYLTQVLQKFECDTFLPEFDPKIYQLIDDPDIDSDVQTDKATQVQFKFTVYQRNCASMPLVPVIRNCQNLPAVPLYVSVAMDRNRGFGLRGQLPWSLKKEFSNFLSLITETSQPGNKVAVIKGRKTWESTTEVERNLTPVINIVISHQILTDQQSADGKLHYVNSFEEALNDCHKLLQSGTIEKVWILGGCPVYQAAFESGLCRRIYLTRIQAAYECDVFLPYFEHRFKKISSSSLEENGVVMLLEVYEPLSADDM
jgi:dihydrofolate reductase